MIINNVAYNHSHDPDFYVDRPYGKNDYLLILLKSPAIFTISGKDIAFPENTIYIYDIDTPQYYRAMEGTTFLHDWIHFLFEKDELDFFKSLEIPFNTPIYCSDTINLSFLIKCISSEKYSVNRHKTESVNCFMKLLFYKLSESIQNNEPTVTDSNYELLSTIKNGIYNKPYERKTVEEAARDVRMSVSGFQHLYKKTFGISFVNDMINSRIEYAKWHLIQTDMSIKDISDICGYNNQTHFFRQFKSITKTTPQEYRTLHKK